MQAIILADKYSYDTTKKIIDLYKSQGVKSFIVCRTSNREAIEEIEMEDHTIIEVKLNKGIKSGGQILKIANLLTTEEPFFLTYGDYLCSIDLMNFQKFHKSHGKALSMAIIKQENKQLFGGFMLVDYDAIGYIEGDQSIFEKTPITKMVEDDEVGWYLFSGSYQIMYQHMKIYGF